MPKPKRNPSQTVDLSREDHLRAKLIDLETFLASEGAKRNAAAMVAGTRLATQLRGELEALRTPATAATVDPTATLADDDLLYALVESIAVLPDEALDQIEDALTLRRTGRPVLRVASSSTGTGGS